MTDQLDSAAGEGTPVKVTETTRVEVQPDRPENWRTLLLVGGIMAVGIVLAAYVLTGPRWGTALLFLASYEAWSLVNSYRDDTISEAIWIYASRPLVPLLFGLGAGVGIGTGYLGDRVDVARGFAIGMCVGHFFWQAQPHQTVSIEKGTLNPKG